MGEIGAPWGPAFVFVAEDGSRVTLQGTDYGFNVQTPESNTGWDLATISADPQGDPEVRLIGGTRFRRCPA